MAVQVNDEAISHLSELIAQEHVAKDSWEEHRPSNDEEISYIEKHGWNDFARWHLALDTDAGQFSKRRYEYLVGDFEKVSSEALKAARERAHRLGFENVEKAAQSLLEQIEGPPSAERVEEEGEEKVEEEE